MIKQLLFFFVLSDCNSECQFGANLEALTAAYFGTGIFYFFVVLLSKS